MIKRIFFLHYQTIKKTGLDGFLPQFYIHFGSTISLQFLDMTGEHKNSSSIPQQINTLFTYFILLFYFRI